MRERAECGRRVAEEFGDRRPDGRKGQRCAGGRRCRLAERGREVLAERAIAGMNPGALRSPVRLDVRGGIRAVARRFELRIGQRRGGRSNELNQRDNQREEPQLHFAQTHEMDANTGWGDPATRNADAGSLTGTLDARGALGVSGAGLDRARPPVDRLCTMQRSPAHRILAGLFGLWMIVTVSGVALQACPEHGGGWMGGAAASTGTHDAAMPMDADMAAAMPASHGHDAHSPGTGHGGHHGHQCTCPGACCTTGLVSVPAGRLVAIPVVPVGVAATPSLVYRDVAPRAAPDVVVPFPLGPPAQNV
jgi:hypothetical protein